MNAYVVSFDTEQTSLYSAHNAITSSPSVSDWWHFLSGTYIITSNKPQGVIDKEIKARWPGGGLLIMRATKNSSGLLPREAWDWINARITA